MDDVAAVAPPVAATSDEGARPRPPATARRARVPRTNSSTIEASTKAENVYAMSPGIERAGAEREQRRRR